jgi:hypothetical protein
MSSRRKSPLSNISTESQYCSADMRLKILSRLPFFDGLSNHAIERINQHFVEVGYQPGERIYSAGDPAERLFVLAEGKVKLLQHALNGRRIFSPRENFSATWLPWECQRTSIRRKRKLPLVYSASARMHSGRF